MLRTRVRVGRCAAVAALTTALLASTGPATSAVAGDTSPPVMTGFRVSTTSVSVSGLATTDVTFSADLSDPSGVYDATAGGAPAVLLLRTSAAGPGGPLPRIGAGQQVVTLALTSGTTAAGTWTGTWHVASTFAGTWDAATVLAQDTLLQIGGTAPASLPAEHVVTVTGDHQPVLRLAVGPRFVSFGSDVVLSGTVTDVVTGAPYAGVDLIVGLGTGSDCAILGIPSRRYAARSGADGTWRRVVPRLVTNDVHACATLILPGTVAVAVAMGDVPTQAVILRLTRSAAVVRHGRSVSVDGVRWPGRVEPVLLERRVGSRWVVVQRSTSRSSGRFTLLPTPSSAGLWTYRVRIPDVTAVRGSGARVVVERGTVSAAFVVRAT